MLDRFPPEILDDILLFASFSPFELYKGRERRNELVKCCLVSKRLLMQAQPLLWQSLVVKPFPSFFRWLDATLDGPRGNSLLELVRSVEAVSVSPKTVSVILEKTTNAREVYLDCSELSSGEALDLKVLMLLPSASSSLPAVLSGLASSLSAYYSTATRSCRPLVHAQLTRRFAVLTTVTLLFVDLAPLTQPFRLPSLTSLSLFGVIFLSSDLNILLSRCVPRLVKLGVGTCFEAPGEPYPPGYFPRHSVSFPELTIFAGSDPYTPFIPPTLLERLDMVQIHGIEPYGIVETHQTPTLRTVGDSDSLESLPPRSHARYLLPAANVGNIIAAVRANRQYTGPFPSLSSAVRATPPRTLHVQSSIVPHDDPSGELRASLRVDAFLEVCEELNVEVVWHEDDGEKPYLISPSFHRYAKELRSKQEAQ
jgi:hypothetical protein